MKPLYQTLKRNHYSSEPSSSTYKSAPDVYTEIGYNLNDLIIKQNVGYANTCATRMSLALLKSGVTFTGRLPIKSGFDVNEFQCQKWRKVKQCVNYTFGK